MGLSEADIWRRDAILSPRILLGGEMPNVKDVQLPRVSDHVANGTASTELAMKETLAALNEALKKQKTHSPQEPDTNDKSEIHHHPFWLFEYQKRKRRLGLKARTLVLIILPEKNEEYGGGIARVEPSIEALDEVRYCLGQGSLWVPEHKITFDLEDDADESIIPEFPIDARWDGASESIVGGSPANNIVLPEMLRTVEKKMRKLRRRNGWSLW